MNKTVARRAPAALLLIALPALGVLLPLRLYQQYSLLEAQTGFWKTESLWICALYVLLGALALVCAGYALARRKKLTLETAPRKRPAEAALAIVAAAALLWDAVQAARFALTVYLAFSRGESVAGTELQQNHALQFFVKSGAIAALLEAVFGSFGSVFFLQMALGGFRPKSARLGPLLALTPLLWSVCRVLRRFARTISYLRVSDLFLSLLGICALTIFLLAFAQLLSGVNARGKTPRLVASGLFAAVLLLICFVPRAVMVLLGRGAELSQDAVLEPCDPALALFLLVFLAGRVRLAPANMEETLAEADHDDTPQPFQRGVPEPPETP
jgi:hypothetical protein